MRPTNFIGFFICLFGLGFAYFVLELYMALVPCPLCILDRFALAASGICFFICMFFSAPKPRWIMLGINATFLCSGIVFSARHSWLQNQPLDPNRPCLSEQEAVAGFMDLIERSFGAHSDCGLIGWELFGLSIPELTLALFIGILGLLVVQAYGIYLDQLKPEDDDSDD